MSEIKLKNNKIYGSGYTADGQAMMVLEEISKACDTSLYFKRGQLVIKNFRDGNKERYRLSPETGLINQPTKVESHDYTGWSVECLCNIKSLQVQQSISIQKCKRKFLCKKWPALL